MSIGRNDPCPCGSGKKYKKCCLGRDAHHAAPDRQQEREDLRVAALAPLMRYAGRPQFRDARDAALELFAGGEADDLGDGEEPIEDDVQAKFAFYYVFDHRLPDGRTVAETFLARAGWQVGPRERALLGRFGAARLRPYEVQEVRVGEGLRLRDLWSDGEVSVMERAGTRRLARWDVLAARIAPDEDGSLRIEGGLYLLPARLKQRLLDALHAHADLLRKIGAGFDEDLFFRTAAPFVHRFWLEHVVRGAPPTLATAEGDLMEFGTVVFDVADRDALVAALNGRPDLDAEHDGGWTWFEQAEDGLARTLGRLRIEDDRLILEVMSRARAARGREMLREAAGDAVRYRSARYESVADALARRRAAEHHEEVGSEGSISPAEGAELVLEFKRRHYRRWPDEPLPALDGRTPRQAARSPSWRPRLIDLLKEMENMEARSARRASPAFDFGPVWQELGVERPA